MEKITLSTDLINGILQYLGSRPFVEVAGLINEIQKQASEQGASPVEIPSEELTTVD
jgi:hypothetical protein